MSRRFTQEEAQRIFAHVAERQRATSTAGEGLSLGELEEAARAAGLDPALVAMAAAELDAAPRPDRTLAGAPVEVSRYRVVAGSFGDDAWARVVAAARTEFGEPGVAGQVGRLREWTLLSGGKSETVTRLTAEPTAEGTRITLSHSVRQTVRGLTVAQAVQASMAAVLGIVVLLGADASLWVPVLILVALAALFAAGTQIGTRVWHRRRARQFERLLDHLDLAARDADGARVQDRPALEADAGGAGRLDLDALPDGAEGGAAPRRRDRA